MGKIVGVDYGRARMGLSISDERKIIAFPFKTIAVSKNLEKAVDLLLDALKENISQIEKIVLGLPLLMSGKKGEMALEVEKFKELLSKKINVEIVLWDERLTSAQAEVSMREMELSRKKRSQKSDVIAAVLILQNYLDSKNFY